MAITASHCWSLDVSATMSIVCDDTLKLDTPMVTERGPGHTVSLKKPFIPGQLMAAMERLNNARSGGDWEK
jgi:hypothetical protein